MLKMYNMINKRLPSWQDPPSSSKIRVRSSVCSALPALCRCMPASRHLSRSDLAGCSVEGLFPQRPSLRHEIEFVDLQSVMSTSKMKHTYFW